MISVKYIHYYTISKINLQKTPSFLKKEGVRFFTGAIFASFPEELQ